MISTRLSAVPLYLKEGAFHSSLDCSNDDEIQIPQNTLKPNLQLTDTIDLDHLLTSLGFWSVENIPFDAIDFILAKGTDVDIDSMKEKFAGTFPILNVLATLSQHPSLSGKEKFQLAIKAGSLWLVKYLINRFIIMPKACDYAAKEGQVQILRYLHQMGTVMDFETVNTAFHAGDIDCLQYLKEVGMMVCVTGFTVFVEALIRTGISTVIVTNLNSFKFALCCGCVMNENSIMSAARLGKLDIIHYAREHGCAWDSSAARVAAQFDQLECLVYIHEHGGEWNADTTITAAESGSLRCLKYACEHGCPYDVNTFIVSASPPHSECLRYMHELGFEWRSKVTTRAAKYGSLECLKYACERGCAYNAKACEAAALTNSLECLIYLHERGCRWDKRTTTVAAAYGNIDCLHYAVSNECPIGDKILHADRHASRECYDYLIERFA